MTRSVVYKPYTNTNTPELFGLLSDFRRALESSDREQIQMHYQPQVELDTGQVVGVEALLRWAHPRYGPISPHELLPGIAGAVSQPWARVQPDSASRARVYSFSTPSATVRSPSVRASPTISK